MKCDFPTDLTAQPQCKPCNGTSSECHYKNSTDCSKDCAWKYQCDFTTMTCKTYAAALKLTTPKPPRSAITSQ